MAAAFIKPVSLFLYKKTTKHPSPQEHCTKTENISTYYCITYMYIIYCMKGHLRLTFNYPLTCNSLMGIRSTLAMSSATFPCPIITAVSSSRFGFSWNITMERIFFENANNAYKYINFQTNGWTHARHQWLTCVKSGWPLYHPTNSLAENTPSAL